ncbi:MAG TPA: NifU N-terminal domain-containing protein [Acidimicrobiales bacterium]|nr:NifU N-terminal domain-containing protein [Acidimicrobiales bacterium]
MATATPSSTPNPNALRFSLDAPVPDDVEQSAFGQAVLGVPGVSSLFGVNDFVTVTRSGDAPWEDIVAAVQAAASEHL